MNMYLILILAVPFHPHVESKKTRWVIERSSVYRDIEKFGRAVREVIEDYGITLWRSAHDMSLQHPEMYADRVHPNRELYQEVSRAFKKEQSFIIKDIYRMFLRR